MLIAFNESENYSKSHSFMKKIFFLVFVCIADNLHTTSNEFYFTEHVRLFKYNFSFSYDEWIVVAMVESIEDR